MITEAQAFEAMSVIEVYVEQDAENRSVMLTLYCEDGGHVMLGFLNEFPEMLNELHHLLQVLEAEGIRTVRQSWTARRTRKE